MVVTYTSQEQEDIITVNYIGQDGGGYLIETNEEEILIFASNLNTSEREFTPDELTFKVYNMPKSNDSKQIALTKDNYSLEHQEGLAFNKITSEEYVKLGEVFVDIDQTIKHDEHTVYFDVAKFFTDNSLEGNQVFRFRYLINGEIVA
jgi:hypothetical protein